MPRRILQDVQEYFNILRGKWRKDLRGLLERGQIELPRPGGGSVIVPVERIHIPRLHFAPIPNDAEIPPEGVQGGGGQGSGQGMGTGGDKPGYVPGDRGVGKGPGKPGTILGPVDRGKGSGDGDGDEDEDEDDKSAGTGRGGDNIKIEIPAEELIELFREILELPRIQPKGSKKIKSEEWKYTDIRRQGPRSLLHKRRTMKEAMKRTLASGEFDPTKNIQVIPIREDMRYRLPEKVIKPKNNAVIFYMMDVSGSMGAEERRIVRYLCSLSSFWLSWNYDGLEEVWIIHDGEADEVKREEFFNTYRGGGTVASTAHQKMLEIMEERFPSGEWNIYVIYLSDGFNWGDDDAICKKMILEKIVPVVNLYAYGEVDVSRYYSPGSSGPFSFPGSFGKMITQMVGSKELKEINKEDYVAIAPLKAMDQVTEAIKKFFGKGR